MLGDSQTITQGLENFFEGYLGWKPLFSGGVQIGNWQVGGGYFDVNAQDVMANLCNQVVTFNPGVTAAQMDPTTWTTTDDWDNPIAVQAYCLQKAVVPNWMSASDLANYVQQPNGSIVPASSSLILPFALGGGLLLLSIILIARR